MNAVNEGMDGSEGGETMDFCAQREEAEWEALMTPCDKIACTLTAFFGYTFINSEYDYSHAAVFRRSDMPSLLCELQGLKQAGKPLVASRTLEVQRNTWWGIEGGFSVKLAVVLLDKS